MFFARTRVRTTVGSAPWLQPALATGEAKLTLGTAAMLDLNVGDTPVFPAPSTFPLALWRLGARDVFCLEASVITAGAVVDWLVGLGLLPGRQRAGLEGQVQRLGEARRHLVERVGVLEVERGRLGVDGVDGPCKG